MTEDTEGIAAEAQLRALIEQAPAGLGLATLDGMMLEAHPALCAVDGRARDASRHDSLTGTANRSQFLLYAGAALVRATRSRALTAVLHLDLDQFRLVNDSLGHQAGDELLVQVTGRLRTAVRYNDRLARVGGDEFAVLCEQIDSPRAAVAMAERLQAALAAPFDLHGRPFFASASIGVALSEAGTGDAAELLRNADTALHRAKAMGRNRVGSFNGGMRREADKLLELSADLHGTLARHELRLFYQPVLRLRDGAVVGAEALIRWQHPTRGLLGPGEFISLAEDTGLIVPIGAWVLEEACRAAAHWPAGSAGEPLAVSVNVSARQLRDHDLVGTVARSLSASGLPASALCLEITESLLMVDVEHSESVLASLKDLGVRLSVDDFGTGYSSLARLKRLPLDYLKIDRSFVDGLGEDEDDEAIVTSVVGLAHAMGMVVVAEGVETHGQLEMLQGLRCESAQGWLWSKAVPEPEFVAWLAARGIGPQSGPAVTATRGFRRPGPARVLVVDNDPDQIELARVLLVASGHEVIPVVDTSHFLEALRQAQPDLVLMDLRMPQRGGLDLVWDLIEQGGPVPPVVAVTGHTDWLARPLLGADGFAGTIAKPIDPEAFVAQVEAFLAGASGGTGQD